MALADITLVDSKVTPLSHVFSFVGTDASGRTLRSNLARTPELPEVLTIGHKKTKIAGRSVDSHLWRLDDSILDGDGVTVRKNDIRVIADIDPATYSDALMEDYAAMLCSAFTEAFMKAFTRGSVG